MQPVRRTPRSAAAPAEMKPAQGVTVASPAMAPMQSGRSPGFLLMCQWMPALARGSVWKVGTNIQEYEKSRNAEEKKKKTEVGRNYFRARKAY